MEQLLQQLEKARQQEHVIEEQRRQIEQFQDAYIATSMKATEENIEMLKRFFKEVGCEDVDKMLAGMQKANEQYFRQNVLSQCAETGQIRLDPPRNQVIEVMCSAAAAHGKRVQELEDARAEIAQLRAKMDEHAKIDAILTQGVAPRTSVLGKRADPEPHTDPSVTECWSQLFQSVESQRM